MASKKTYINRDNPALNFLSIGIEEEEPERQPVPEEQKPVVRSVPDGYKANPLLIEKKTRRLQLILQPSLYAKVKARAAESGKSVNDYIHTILENAVEE